MGFMKFHYDINFMALYMSIDICKIKKLLIINQTKATSSLTFSHFLSSYQLIKFGLKKFNTRIIQIIKMIV